MMMMVMMMMMMVTTMIVTNFLKRECLVLGPESAVPAARPRVSLM